MPPQQNVFLVGPMGAGKTTIGRILAKKLNYTFFDLDEEIEKSCGAEIAWIFDVEGEAGFRKRESALLETLSKQTPIVLATGGGVILSEENRKVLQSRGLVVYLEARAEQLYQRTRYDKKRPLLQVDEPEQVIKELLKTRDPLYRQVADIIIPTGRQSPQAVASLLKKQISEHIG